MVRGKRTKPGKDFKSGYAILLGRPNAGKSTLLNAMLGEEISIVTPKPQTTRNRILGIATTDDYQVIFLDTPGVVRSERGLKAFLAREIQRAMADADVIVLLVEPFGEPKPSERELIEKLKKLNRPVVLAINKVDKVKKENLLPLMELYQELHAWQAIVPVSALKKNGVEAVLAEVVKAMPTGPMYYPPDQFTDATERFIVAEMIREQVFRQTRQEIPFSSAVLVQSFKEFEGIVHIAAEIFVEREGQKGIVIGKNGEMLKRIGTAARQKIETFLGRKVFLELYAKVKKDWTRSESKMREVGYQ